jgi:hypothetical protein
MAGAVGFKGNRLKKRLAGAYLLLFRTIEISICLQNPRNLLLSCLFLAAILQVRQVASMLRNLSIFKFRYRF